MDTNNIVHTLVAIVQAYASIFAIAGAFFVFVIERTRSELNDIEVRVDENLTRVRAMIYDWNPELAGSIDYNLIKEKGVKFIRAQTEGKIPPEAIFKIHTSRSYFTLEDSVPRLQVLKNRTGMWAFRIFKNIFILCAVILAFSIFFLYYISFTEMKYFDWISYHAIVICSILGIGLFMSICWKLAQLYQKGENS